MTYCSFHKLPELTKVQLLTKMDRRTVAVSQGNLHNETPSSRAVLTSENVPDPSIPTPGRRSLERLSFCHAFMAAIGSSSSNTGADSDMNQIKSNDDPLVSVFVLTAHCYLMRRLCHPQKPMVDGLLSFGKDKASQCLAGYCISWYNRYIISYTISYTHIIY